MTSEVRTGKRTSTLLGVLAVVLLFGLPLFFGLASEDLRNDEAIYSYAVDRIVESGNWLTPESIPQSAVPGDLHDRAGAFLEKPPLKFWIVALPIKLGLLPHDEVGLRFWDALFGAIAFVYVFLIGRRLVDPVCGFAAVFLLFIQSWLLFGHGLRSNVMEAALLLAYTGGIHHFLAWSESDVRSSRWLHILAFAGWFSFGFMTKFLAAIFLPMVVGLTALCFADWRRRLRTDAWRWLAGAVVALVLIVPWFAYEHVIYGADFWKIIFGAHIYDRLRGILAPEHTQPWYYYFDELHLQLSRAGAFGWVVAGAVLWLVESVRRRWKGGSLILVWYLLPIGIISMSVAKQQWYMIPFLPPVALVGAYPVSLLVRLPRRLQQARSAWADALVERAWLYVATAWGEVWSSRKRLAFVVVWGAVGVGAIVAGRSAIQSVRGVLVAEARALTAADVYVRTRQPWTARALDVIEKRLAETPGIARTQIIETAAMTRPVDERKRTTTVVELRGLQAGFPFYGQLKLRENLDYSHELLRDGGVLVAPELLTQLDVEVGEQLAIGDGSFTIRGVVLSEPGQQLGAFSFGPRVLINYGALDQTGLLRFARNTGWQILLKLSEAEIEPLVRQLREDLREEFVDVGSYRDGENPISENLLRAEAHLNLIGFVVLILGAVGVWSVKRVFVQQRIPRLFGGRAVRWFLVRLAACSFAVWLVTVLLGPIQLELSGVVIFSDSSIAFIVGAILLFALLPLRYVVLTASLALVLHAWPVQQYGAMLEPLGTHSRPLGSLRECLVEKFETLKVTTPNTVSRIYVHLPRGEGLTHNYYYYYRPLDEWERLDSPSDADLYVRLFVPGHRAPTLIFEEDYEQFLQRIGRPELREELRELAAERQDPRLTVDDPYAVVSAGPLPGAVRIRGAGTSQALVVLPGPLASCVDVAVGEGGEPFEFAAAPGPWRAAFFDNQELSGQPKAVTQHSSIDFDWGRGVPLLDFPEDNFSVRWDTCVTVAAAATVTFQLTSDDGSRLLIDGRTIVDHWGEHGLSTKEGVTVLTAGVHHVEVHYSDVGLYARVRLRADEGLLSREQLVHPTTNSALPCSEIGASQLNPAPL